MTKLIFIWGIRGVIKIIYHEKGVNVKKVPIANSLCKFTLIIEWTLYIYICIYRCYLGNIFNGTLVSDLIIFFTFKWIFKNFLFKKKVSKILGRENFFSLALIYIYIYIYISSLCHATSTDFPGPLSPLVSILDRFRNVFHATSRAVVDRF